MRLPLLALVAGPTGSGRPELARRLAAELNVPLLTRDTIRAGLVETQAGWTVMPAVETVAMATTTYDQVLDAYLAAGVTVVAEHPLRAAPTAADLARLEGVCRPKLISCRASGGPGETKTRPRRTIGLVDRRPENPWESPAKRTSEATTPTNLGVPFLDVESTGGRYRPPLADIIWFLRQNDA